MFECTGPANLEFSFVALLLFFILCVLVLRVKLTWINEVCEVAVHTDTRSRNILATKRERRGIRVCLSYKSTEIAVAATINADA